MLQAVTQPAVDDAAARAASRLSFEEFLADESIPPHTEWVDGEARPMAGVTNLHGELTTWLILALGVYVDLQKVGVVRHDPFLMRLEAGGSARAPDVLVLLNEHRDRLQDQHLAGPADLVVEVISPGSRNTDRGEKFYEYEAAGVPEYWMLDPLVKRAEFHVLDDGHYRPAPRADGVFTSRVLPQLSLPVDWLWQDPKPSVDQLLQRWG